MNAATKLLNLQAAVGVVLPGICQQAIATLLRLAHQIIPVMQVIQIKMENVITGIKKHVRGGVERLANVMKEPITLLVMLIVQT